jgi:hypothetical protein
LRGEGSGKAPFNSRAIDAMPVTLKAMPACTTRFIIERRFMIRSS